ncbi:MAG TPA: 4'-phosphopantetheinyl transferase superfamily protein, partial [Opitutales bacterium]|nr:4'-phosphopantetheinyl transferase superfamily protein [Opitutales bacterium]
LLNLSELNTLKNTLFGAASTIVFQGSAIDAYALSTLTLEEKIFAEKLADRRKSEWAAGRHCAQQALRSLGASHGPLLSDATRAPIWPNGFMGSIAHTHHHAFAAVGKAVQGASIGIDVEIIDRLPIRLWSKTLVEAELQALTQMPESERGRYATAIFSLKEAFYKYQFPISQSWLGLLDACVYFAEDDTQTATLEILQSIGPWAVGHTFKGRYTWSGPYVFSAFC